MAKKLNIIKFELLDKKCMPLPANIFNTSYLCFARLNAFQANVPVDIITIRGGERFPIPLGFILQESFCKQYDIILHLNNDYLTSGLDIQPFLKPIKKPFYTSDKEVCALVNLKQGCFDIPNYDQFCSISFVKKEPVRFVMCKTMEEINGKKNNIK